MGLHEKCQILNSQLTFLLMERHLVFVPKYWQSLVELREYIPHLTLDKLEELKREWETSESHVTLALNYINQEMQKYKTLDEQLLATP